MTKKTKTVTKRKKKSKLPDHEIERIREVTPTIDELRIIDVRRDYRAIRKNHFGNSIPPVEEILIGFVPPHEMKRIGAGEDADGGCLAGFIGKKTACYAITIADDMKVAEQRITLLHEMAHLKVNIEHGRQMGHGETFKKEKRRLAASGAYDEWT